ALTKLVKKVKYLEDKQKSTIKRRKTKMVISDKEEDLILADPSKQGRMSETEYDDIGTEYQEPEYELDQTTTMQQATLTKVPQGEKPSQETSKVQLDVLSAAKILAEVSKEKVKTYDRRRRSTHSLTVGTAGGLFSTVEEILCTDERLAQKLNKEKKRQKLQHEKNRKG
ncbi:hypothetical protein Tco_0373051, partial [Tanacetum coccineum]